MRRPRPQAVGARGAPHLPFGFATKPSPSASWARGLLSVFWERGSPDLPACGLWCGSSGGPVRPIFISARLKTLARDQASQGRRHKTSSGMASPGRLARRRRDQGRGTSRGARDASHDDRDQAGADLCSVLVSSLVQRGQAQARSTEASSKGYHFGAMRPRPAERQDGGHRGAQDGVIASAFGSRRPPLVRITCTRCSPSKWPIVGALPAQYLGRGPGPL